VVKATCKLEVETDGQNAHMSIQPYCRSLELQQEPDYVQNTDKDRLRLQEF